MRPVSQQNSTNTKTAGPPSALARIGRDSLIYLPTVVIPAVAGIVTIRVLTTIFTRQEYGWYNVALSTIGLLKVLGGVWLGTSAARFFLRSRLEKKEDLFVSTLFLTSLGSAAGVAGLAYLALHFLRSSQLAHGILNLTIAVAFFSTLFEVLVVTFRAGLQPKRYARYWIAYTVLKPLVGIGAILLLHLRVEGILLGFLASPIFLLFVLAKSLGLFAAVRNKFFDRALLSNYLRFGLPLGFTSLATWLLSLSDRYFIQFYRGSEEVGLYSVGYALPEKTLQFAFMALMLSTYPILVDTYENKGQQAAETLLAQVTRVCLLVCTPILALLFALSRDLVLLLADSKFVTGSRVVPFIALALFFSGLNQLAGKGFELHKRSEYIAGIAVVAGLTNVALNALLVPKLGFLGAALAACTSYFVLLTITSVTVRRFLAWRVPVRTAANAGLALGTTLLALHLVTLGLGSSLLVLFVKLPIAFATFYGTLMLVREVSPAEIRSASTFLHSTFQRP